MRPREKLFKQQVFPMMEARPKLFSKIQDGDHFRSLNISAAMRPREKVFKHKVFQMTSQGRNFFNKSKMEATSGFSIIQQLCVLEKNFSNKKCSK
jgi:hypothetical protein